MSCGCTTCDDDHVVTPEGGCFGPGKRKARRASREAVTPGSIAPERDAPVRSLLDAAPWLAPGRSGWGGPGNSASVAAPDAVTLEQGPAPGAGTSASGAHAESLLEASPEATRALATAPATQMRAVPLGPSALNAGTKEGGGGGGGAAGDKDKGDGKAQGEQPPDAQWGVFQFQPPSEPAAQAVPCGCKCECDEPAVTPVGQGIFALAPHAAAGIDQAANPWSPLASFRRVWGLGPTFSMAAGSLGGVPPSVARAGGSTAQLDPILVSASAGAMTAPSGEKRVAWAGPTGLVVSLLPAGSGLGSWSAPPGMPTVAGASDGPGAGVRWDPPNPDADETDPLEWRPWHPGDPDWRQPGMPRGPVDQGAGRAARPPWPDFGLGDLSITFPSGTITGDDGDGDGDGEGGGGGGASRGGGLELESVPIDRMSGSQAAPLPSVEPPWTLVPAAGPSVTVPASPGPPIAVKRPSLEPSRDPARRSALVSVGPGSVGGPEDPARAAARDQESNRSRLQALDQAARRDEFAARLQGHSALGPSDGRYGNTRALALDVGPEAAEAGVGRGLSQVAGSVQAAVQAEQRSASGVAPPQSGAVQIGRGTPVRSAEGAALRPPRLSRRELSAGDHALRESSPVLAPDVAVLDDGSAVSPSENDVIERPAVLPGGQVGGRGTPRDAADAAAASSRRGTHVPGDTVATDPTSAHHGVAAAMPPQYAASAIGGIGRVFGPGARTTDAFRFDSLLPAQGKGGGGGGRPPGTDDLAAAMASLERAQAARDLAGPRPDSLAQQATADILGSLDAVPSAGSSRSAQLAAATSSDRETQLLGHGRVPPLVIPPGTSEATEAQLRQEHKAQKEAAAKAAPSRKAREEVLRQIARGDEAANAAHDAYLEAVANVVAVRQRIAEEHGERGLAQAERDAARIIEQDTRRQQARGAQSNAREAARITKMAAGAAGRVQRAVNRASDSERQAAGTAAWQSQADAMLGAASDLIAQGQVDRRVNGERDAGSYDLMNLAQAEKELASAVSSDGRRLAREARRRVPEHERALRAQDKKARALDKKIAKLERQAEANPAVQEQLDAARRERDELTQQREATEQNLAEDQRVAGQEKAAQARVKQLKRLGKKSKLTRSQQRARDKALEVLSEARRNGADLPAWADAEVDAWEMENPGTVLAEPAPALGGGGGGPPAPAAGDDKVPKARRDPGCEACEPPKECPDGPYTCKSLASSAWPPPGRREGVGPGRYREPQGLALESKDRAGRPLVAPDSQTVDPQESGSRESFTDGTKTVEVARPPDSAPSSRGGGTDSVEVKRKAPCIERWERELAESEPSFDNPDMDFLDRGHLGRDVFLRDALDGFGKVLTQRIDAGGGLDIGWVNLRRALSRLASGLNTGITSDPYEANPYQALEAYALAILESEGGGARLSARSRQWMLDWCENYETYRELHDQNVRDTFAKLQVLMQLAALLDLTEGGDLFGDIAVSLLTSGAALAFEAGLASFKLVSYAINVSDVEALIKDVMEAILRDASVGGVSRILVRHFSEIEANVGAAASIANFASNLSMGAALLRHVWRVGRSALSRGAKEASAAPGGWRPKRGASHRGRGKRSPPSRRELVDELERTGVKHTPEDIVRIARDPNGKVVFLEKGNPGAGLAHIERHAPEFAKVGVAQREIPDLVMDAATRGRQVGRLPGGRPVFEVEFNGRTMRVAVEIGDNGFVVGANPVSMRRRLQ